MLEINEHFLDNALLDDFITEEDEVDPILPLSPEPAPEDETESVSSSAFDHSILSNSHRKPRRSFLKELLILPAILPFPIPATTLDQYNPSSQRNGNGNEDQRIIVKAQVLLHWGLFNGDWIMIRSSTQTNEGQSKTKLVKVVSFENDEIFASLSSEG